jgi:signal transduction histidine kinase/ligand-binding sensor domain-containing protein
MSATRILLWLLLTYSMWQPCQRALALNPDLDVSAYAHTAWRFREGFVTDEIESLAQTPDGYLWLGTSSGLVRFDGVKTSRWQPPTGFSLPDRWIRSLLATRDGTLWIGTVAGLASLSGSQLTAYPQLDGALVSSLLEDREGTVWVGAATPPSYTEGLLCAIRSGRTECYDRNGRFPGYVAALWQDRRGDLWVASANRVWRWKPDPPKLYSLPSSLGYQGLGETATGAIIVASEKSVHQIIDGEVKELPLPHLPQQFAFSSVLCDQDGAIWIGSDEAGLLHVHSGRADWFTRADGLSGDHVKRLFEDREGNIWVATLEGMDRFHALPATTYSRPQGVIGRMGSVLADRDGGLWFTTTEGLYKWHEGRIAVYRGEHQRPSKLESAREPVLEEVLVAGIPGKPAGSLYEDRHHRLWLGTQSELGYLENNRFIYLRGVPSGYIDSFAEDTEGNLWIAHRDAGLLRLSTDLRIRDQFPWKILGVSGLAGRLAADPVRGGLWIGSYSGGIVYFSNGRVRASYGVREGLGKGSVNHLRVAADGTLWVATEGGLSRLKAGRITTLDSTRGLPCDGVDSSTDDGQGSVWLYTDCGLVRVASSDLEGLGAAVQEGNTPIDKVRMPVLGDSDGIRSFVYLTTFSPHLTTAADGKLWLAAHDGVTVVDPEHLALNKLPPPVHIEEVVADRTTYQLSSPLRLPPLVHELEIGYTALSLVAPEKIRFRYKLEGRDRDWREAGNRRTAFDVDLPPGSYRFRVIASNNSGVWNEQGDTLDFSVAPAFWQTIWFKTLCVAAFLGFLWMLYQLRLRQVTRQFELGMEARVAERTRIARELHDTLLQSFQGLLLRFQTAARLLPTRPAEAREVLESTMDQAEQALTDGRNAVQGLRPSAVESYDLADAIKSVGEELAADPARERFIPLSLRVEGTPGNLQPIVRDEIYRIAGEALRNAYRHSGATRIEVELQYDRRQFELRVRDNGKGIDLKFLSEGGHGQHFGLSGMRERAAMIGGRLTLWTSADSGTEIELRVPGSRAYRASLRRRSWLERLSAVGRKREP